MRSISPTVLSGLATSLVAGLALAGEPQPSPEQMKQALEFMAESFAEIKPDDGPVVAEEIPGGLPREVSVDQLRRGLALLQKSFYFRAFSDSAKNISIEGDPHHVPGGPLVTGRLAWTAAKAADGKNLIDSKANQADDRLRDLDRVADMQVELTAAAKDVRRAEGQLTVRYPKGLGIVEFPAGDTLSRKPLKTVTCRLLSLENNLAAVWCSGRGNGVTLFPVSAGGAVLASSESMTGPFAVYQEVKKSQKLSNATLTKLSTSLADAEKDGVAFLVKAKGKVAKVVAVEPAGFEEEKLKIEALPRPKFEQECPAIPNPRYARAVPPANFAVVDEPSIRAATQIVPSRSEAMVGFNEHVIRILLPRHANSLLAKLEVKNLTLTKGGKKVAFEPQGPFRDDTGYGFSFRMEGGQKPVDFDKATGAVELRYPVKVTTRKVPAGKKDAMVAIRGCSVEISGDAVDASPRAIHPSVRAYAANGLALKVVREYSEAGMKDGKDFSVLRFWGTVATVEVDEVKEWKTVSLPLNFKPAPALRR